MASGPRWARPRPRAPTSSSSPTTTRGPRTRSDPRRGPRRAPRRRGHAPHELRDVERARRAPSPQAVRAAHDAGPGSSSPSSARATRPGRRSPGRCTPSTTGTRLAAPSSPAGPDRLTTRTGERDDPDVPRARSPRSPADACTVSTTTRPRALVVDGPVVTDSREAGPGGLYVARVGEQRTATSSSPPPPTLGAVAAMTTRPVDELPVRRRRRHPGRRSAALARAVVDRHPDLTVDRHHRLVGQDLHQGPARQRARQRRARPSPRSGRSTPRSACRSPSSASTPQTRFLVVEMGARGIGHIAYLTRIAPPGIGIVLNVGTAHVGEFGSREAIAVAKARARRRPCPPTGLAVLNADDPAVRAMAAADRRPRAAGGVRPRRPTCGPTDVTLDAVRTADLPGDDARRQRRGRPCRCTASTTSATPSPSWPRRSSAAWPCPTSSRALATATPAIRWRMEVTERPDGVTVVNDAYNANPDSMRAALKALVAMGGGRGGADAARRTWAVLGAMLELGDDSDGRARRDRPARGAARASTGSSSWADAARPMAAGAAARGIVGRRGASGCPTPTPPYALLSRRASSPATSCCSSRAATPDYGGSETDWPAGRRNSEEGTT